MRRPDKLLLAGLCLFLFGSARVEARGFEDHELGDFYRLGEVDDDVVLAASEAIIRFPTATGFLVDPDGLILTNHHVFESFGERGTVWRRWVGDGSEQALTIELVDKDAKHDVAIYRVVGEHGPFPFLELRERSVVRGERVFVLGHPSGDPIRASFGTVLADGLNISGRPSVEYSAQTWWGSSGSPVIDEHGRVVAIHWGWDSTGISNGRLTGVPATKLLKLDGFAELGRGDRSVCNAGWSLASTLTEARVRKNASGRWLDQIEVRPVHDDRSCEAKLAAVTFTLHPTFRDPIRRVAGGDSLTLYTWGSFETSFELELTDGRTVELVDRVTW